ncbi:SLC13 family permease [Aquisalimonas asiatica]|uniref:Di-and tricarboxylate transporter n=1 Tax=Aquisalimonas asiatica TaxID=406100 RepID=A0A1H8UVS2_9GAMM|nr:SLC13 family permease [Aquisalimonas asiatica]SEP07044.1 Di-and tricarboxylate transporter [Aquisalimonas asiatica]
MGWEAWLTVAVVVGVLGTLILTRMAADMVFLGGLTILLLAGVLDPSEAFRGLANQGLITVAVLYVVVSGLQETGGIHWVVQRLLGRPRSLAHAQVKLMTPVAFMSAFLNNTPVVAMLIPAVNEWARKFGLSNSKLMIPLSYAAILGGTCTLIGTSTNLVVNGLVTERTGEGMRMFDLAWVGVPVAVVGLAFILLTTRWLLPERQPAMSRMSDPREYSVEMLVDTDGPLVGKSIESAGLRHLSGMFLAEIDRNGSVLPAVSPREKLQSGDRLVFVGVVESVVELQKIRGLTPATEQVFKLEGLRSQRIMIEAVVSGSCPVVGKTIRDGRFRSRYNAVVIAVARNGERLGGKIGDIVIQPGDTLLLEARQSFVDQQRNSRDFFLVSQVEDSSPPRHERAPLAIGLLGVMVVTAGFGWLSMLEAALLAAAGMLVTGCCTVETARRNIDWSVLLVIAAAFGLGAAMDQTGVALATAQTVMGFVGDAPLLNLAAIYLLTAGFTAVITNNAAALLMFPIAFAVSSDLGVSVMPFVVAIMLAASASFATPIGYQTNLMVYGPGGYHFSDFLRLGLPLNLVTALVAILVIPLVWGF